jgi:hypothetical protein
MISGWLRGVGVWALSVPLILIIGACLSGAAGLAYGVQNTAHMTEYIANNTQVAQLHQGDLFVSFGGAWTVFIGLILGLFSAMIGGSMMPAGWRRVSVSSSVTTTEHAA